jgi:hypothetical protein
VLGGHEHRGEGTAGPLGISGAARTRLNEAWFEERIEATVRGSRMQAYETSATVEPNGQVRLAGVPFAPGTQVEVIISPKRTSAAMPDAAAADRAAPLFAALDKARNVQSVGGLKREELYDRSVLH